MTDHYATEDAVQDLRDELYEMNEPEESFAALTDEFAHAKQLDGRRCLAEAFIGSDWLKAQLAAARREALLEADSKHRAEVERLAAFERHAAELAVSRLERAEKAETEVERLRATIARVEALVDAAEKRSPIGAAYDRTHPNDVPAILIPGRTIRAALAEPERDEESGR